MIDSGGVSEGTLVDPAIATGEAEGAGEGMRLHPTSNKASTRLTAYEEICI